MNYHQIKRLDPSRRDGASRYEVQTNNISQTVPHDCLTIQEIMRRHVAGMNLSDLQRAEAYDSGADFDTVDLEQVNRLDLYEKNELLTDAKKRVVELKNALQKAQTKISTDVSEATRLKTPTIGADADGGKKPIARNEGLRNDDAKASPDEDGGDGWGGQ